MRILSDLTKIYRHNFMILVNKINNVNIYKNINNDNNNIININNFLNKSVTTMMNLVPESSFVKWIRYYWLIMILFSMHQNVIF